MKYLYQSIFIVALILVFSCEEEVKQERSVKETLFTELPPSEIFHSSFKWKLVNCLSYRMSPPFSDPASPRPEPAI